MSHDPRLWDLERGQQVYLRDTRAPAEVLRVFRPAPGITSRACAQILVRSAPAGERFRIVHVTELAL
jgi:hypothetical protein